jgi:hypothetical protein
VRNLNIADNPSSPGDNRGYRRLRSANHPLLDVRRRGAPPFRTWKVRLLRSFEPIPYTKCALRAKIVVDLIYPPNV